MHTAIKSFILVKNLSRLTSRSFLLKLLIDDAETTVLDKLYHCNKKFLTSILHVCLACLKQVAQLSLTNPRDALHHDKQLKFKTVT